MNQDSNSNGSRIYIEIFMIVTMLLAVLPPFFNELHGTALQLLDVVRIINKRLNQGNDNLVIEISFKRKVKKFMKKNCKSIDRCCTKMCSCCVEDYMAQQQPTSKSTVNTEESDSEDSEEDSDDDENENKKKNKIKIVTVQEKQDLVLKNSELPKDEIKRLRAELSKLGYTTEARIMRGHM